MAEAEGGNAAGGASVAGGVDGDGEYAVVGVSDESDGYADSGAYAAGVVAVPSGSVDAVESGSDGDVAGAGEGYDSSDVVDASSKG